jgi:Carboxypeptidase regulatory-like domain/TonB dependent receptor-like, beta-barrel
MSPRLRRWLAACTVLLGVVLVNEPCLHAFAQGSASVSGRVTDQTGAVIAEAVVDITDVETAVSQTTKTNGEGLYSFLVLKPGRYAMTVHKDSFESVTISGLILNVAEHVSRDVVLKVGAVEQSVTVTAETSHVNTVDGSVSTVTDRATVENMPLNGRSFQSLLELTPGINAINPMSVTPANVQSAQGQFTVNGQRPDANYFIVDGVSANTGASSGGLLGQSGTGSLPATTALGGFNGLVSVDALQEFRVTTSSFAPEYGRTPGGQVSIVTRAGTNGFHGDAFDYFRDTALDANDWFLKRAGQPKGTVRQNDFGGVIGGPVVKDKVFFFGSYEGLRLTNPQPASARTFTADARVLANNSRAGGSSGYMYQILNAYPQPDHDTSKGDGSTCVSAATCTAPFTRTFANTSQLDSTSIRLDHALSGTMTMFGRYVHSPSSSTVDGSAAAINMSRTTLGSDSATFAFTDVITNSINNDLRVNYTRSTLQQSLTPPPGFTGTLSTLFPSATPPSNYSLRAMVLAYTFLGLGVPSLNIGESAANNKQDQFNLVDTLNVLKGSHALKFGVDFRLSNPNVNQAPYALNANFFTTFGASGCSVGPPVFPPPPSPPQFICGRASSTTVQSNSDQEFRFPNWSFFAQDIWKIAPRLTLTYGVRYEINPPPSSLNGKPLFSLTNWDPVQCTTTPSFTPGATICNVGINPLGTAPYRTGWGNIAPRVGAAYRLSPNPKWGSVLRAGFGVFYDTAANAASSTLGPFSPATTGPTGGPGTPCSGFFVQFPVTDPGCLTPPPAQTVIGPDSPYTVVAQAIAPNLRLPYTLEFNVAVQQALGSHQSVTMSYVSAAGRDLIGAVPTGAVTKLGDPLLGIPSVTIPLSRTFPDRLIVYGNYASSDYHALQISFQRQFHEGLGATASYTLAHSMDDASNFNAGAVFPLSVNRSDSDFDIRHTFAASLLYDAPTPFRNNHLASALLAHWSFDLIYHFQTAPPVNPIASLNASNGVFTETQRPSLIPGIPVYVYGDDCAAEYGGACPGGFGFNNAPVGARLGATEAQAAAAGCEEGTVVGPFCRPARSIVPGASSASPQGNAGRNSLRGFNLQQLDLNVHRDFRVAGEVHLRFEADVFNVLNRANFASPNAILTDPNFGTSHSLMNASFGAASGGGYNSLYTMGGPRTGQLAIKLLF